MPPLRGSHIQRYGIFPVAVVLALVAYTYFAYVVRLCIPLIQTGAIGQAIIYLVVYHVMLAMSLLCYARVLARKPGSVDRDSLPAYLKTQPQAFAFADSVAPPDNDPQVQINGSDNLKIRPPPPSQSGEVFAISSLSHPYPTSAPPAGSTPVLGYHPLTTTRNGKWRWCNQCQIVKPDRAHHCNVCGECVLKMDHHCPWVNGCVGFRNHRFFVQFVAYSALLSLFMAVSALAAYVGHGMQDTFDYNVLAMIIITAVFDFVFIPFAGTHLGLTLLNRTTIENASWRSWRLARDGWPPRRSRRRLRDSVEVHPEDVEAASREPMTWTAKGETLTTGGQNMFDLGWRKNWSQVMGENWWLWFVPFGKIPGNGLNFPVNPTVYTEYRDEIIVAKERTQDAPRVEQPER